MCFVTASAESVINKTVTFSVKNSIGCISDIVEVYI